MFEVTVIDNDKPDNTSPNVNRKPARRSRSKFSTALYSGEFFPKVRSAKPRQHGRITRQHFTWNYQCNTFRRR
ncbi:MAG: hypothetical protein LBF88_08745 [Planctomycetaceae bacterium]|nr:hypothetical protein [Planctomycetaceae bacterium]